MDRIIGLILLCLTAFSVNAANISNIYITASGNNKFEAKAKAEYLGRERVLAMLASKFGVYEESKDYDYDTLAKVFKIYDVIGVKSSSSTYAATVSFEYEQSDLNKLFLKYYPKESAKKFAEYLVVPVFKQGSKIRVWLKDNDWLRLWGKHQEELQQAKLLYGASFAELRKAVTSDNLFDYKYADFLKLLPNTLFKGVLIVVLEHYTSDDGNGYIVVDYLTLDDSDENEVYSENISIATPEDVNESMQDVIENILYSYGSAYVSNVAKGSNHATKSAEIKTIMPNFIMRAEFYNAEEQEELTRKLNTIQALKKVEIAHDFGAKYSIALYTQLTEEELAKSLYKSGLSYVKRGDSYLLINVLNGV